MKDRGLLHHFLEVIVEPHQYTLDILEQAGLTDCKPCSTPDDTHGKILEAACTLVTDPTAY